MPVNTIITIARSAWTVVSCRNVSDADEHEHAEQRREDDDLIGRYHLYRSRRPGHQQATPRATPPQRPGRRPPTRMPLGEPGEDLAPLVAIEHERREARQHDAPMPSSVDWVIRLRSRYLLGAADRRPGPVAGQAEPDDGGDQPAASDHAPQHVVADPVGLVDHQERNDGSTTPNAPTAERTRPRCDARLVRRTNDCSHRPMIRQTAPASTSERT